MTPGKVTRPSSGKDLAASLLNGVDSSGNLQVGFAIDMIPYLLAAQAHVGISEYRSSYLTRFIARASLSFGMIKGVTDDKSSHFATGLRLSLFDRGDPRADADLDACFDAAFRSYADQFRPSDLMKQAADANEAATSKLGNG